jgi:hypothetical protein
LRKSSSSGDGKFVVALTCSAHLNNQPLEVHQLTETDSQFKEFVVCSSLVYKEVSYLTFQPSSRNHEEAGLT